MTLQTPEIVSTRIDWRVFTIVGNTMPPTTTTKRTKSKTTKRIGPTNSRLCASRTKTEQDAYVDVSLHFARDHPQSTRGALGRRLSRSF
ncbi:hypothetical protein AOQ73_28185 [Bradyrhizobium pachyrhizi]|nr:hypothetical protein AOQ73_28185 [Bradyrhizobium pachyrhizi]